MTDNKIDTKESVKNSEFFAQRIKAIETQLMPIMAELEDLKRKRDDALSVEFIKTNKITREQVETSYGNGKPWFGTAWEFGKWVLQNSKKVWAEWNGRIYHSIDLANGRMPDMPGMMESLKD